MYSKVFFVNGSTASSIIHISCGVKARWNYTKVTYQHGDNHYAWAYSYDEIKQGFQPFIPEKELYRNYKMSWKIV